MGVVGDILIHAPVYLPQSIQRKLLSFPQVFVVQVEIPSAFCSNREKLRRAENRNAGSPQKSS